MPERNPIEISEPSC